MTIPTRFARLFVLVAAATAAVVAPTLAKGANPEQVAQLLKTNRCVGCDLKEAQLGTAKLSAADLSGSDLSGAFMYRADLRGAILTDAKFFGADLKGANLTGARDADLKGAVTNERTTCPNGNAGPCQQ